MVKDALSLFWAPPKGAWLRGRSGIGRRKSRFSDLVLQKVNISCLLQKRLIFWRMPVQTTVTKRGQTVIPAAIRKRYQNSRG